LDSDSLGFLNAHPYSPDLNLQDVYLWRYLKDNVYQNNPQTIGELKAAITAKISEIPKEERVRVIGNFAQCMQVCLQCHSSQLEHILERTWRLCKATSMTKT